MNDFLAKLTKNIEIELSGLFVENFLYNFIRDFLYASTKIEIAPYYYTVLNKVNIPVIGINYIIVYDKTRLVQHIINKNIFIIIGSDETVIEILGEYKLDFRHVKESEKEHFMSLKRIINCGTTAELKPIEIYE